VRSVSLIRIAAEAELLRLRAMVARQGRRLAFGMVAFIFVVGVLILAEVAGWQALRLYVASIEATLILLGVNLVIAVIFGLLAVRSSPGHAEQEALRVRQQALEAARGSLALTTMVPVATTLLRRRRGGRQQPWLQRFRCDTDLRSAGQPKRRSGRTLSTNSEEDINE